MNSAMKLKRTSDVSPAQLDDLYRSLRSYVNVEIDSGLVGYKSVDAPSWIRLAADLDWWQQVLSAYAALYVATLVKEAAKESWQKRSKAVSAMFRGTNSLRAIARAIKASADTYDSRTAMVLFIPQPHSHFGTSLRLYTDATDEIEVQLAIFAHHLSGIKDIIDRNATLNCNPATGYFLDIADDGGMTVEWFHPTTLKKHCEILPLNTEG